MVIKQLFILLALCASQVSFGMQPTKLDQDELDKELFKAATEHQLERVEQLLNKGANPNVKDGGRGIIYWLAEGPPSTWEDWQICDRLIAAGADVNLHANNGSFALYAATKYECEDLCQRLLDAGADPNLPMKKNLFNPNNVLVGKTALELAVSHQNFKICKMLLKAGADPNVCDYKKMTPLMYVNCSVSICELLLQYGADSMMRDSDGKLAIDYVQSDLIHSLPSNRKKLEDVIALLSDPEKIRALILRDDNPCLEMKPWRETSPNIFNALMGREMGGK